MLHNKISAWSIAGNITLHYWLITLAYLHFEQTVCQAELCA